MVAESGSGLTHEEIQAAEGLLRFIDESPSAFTRCLPCVLGLTRRIRFSPRSANLELQARGMLLHCAQRLEHHSLQGGRCVSEGCHFQITASHSDSPLFKIKAQPDLEGPGSYRRLNVEAYGGMIDYTWFDRPLSLAGRVMVQIGNRIESRLVSLDRDVALIPSLAIHMDLAMNNGFAPNRRIDLCPVVSAGALEKETLQSFLGQ